MKPNREEIDSRVTDADILDQYKPFVRFLAITLGPACEVVLHDITDPKHSIIAIENGELSGRKVGNPATDFANEIIASRGYEHSDFAANYTSTGKGKHFLSSTFYIKNGQRLIGLLCINRDISSASQLESALSLLRKQFNLNLDPQSDIRERIENPINTKESMTDFSYTWGVEQKRRELATGAPISSLFILEPVTNEVFWDARCDVRKAGN